MYTDLELQGMTSNPPPTIFPSTTGCCHHPSHTAYCHTPLPYAPTAPDADVPGGVLSTGLYGGR